MIFSKQIFYCNCCGKQLYCDSDSVLGSKFLGWRICSIECVREIRWKETLSIMNSEYYPNPNTYKD